MRICLIGNFRPNLDEGFTNVAFNMARELGKHHEIMKLNLWPLSCSTLCRGVIRGHPQVIHYLTTPSIVSFWILRALSLYWRGSKTVMSVLHPDALSLRRRAIFRRFIPVLRPDLVLVQYPETEEMFTTFGCQVGFLPNGVDTDRFRPCSPESKEQLREKYGIDPGKFVILHIGHLRRDRNLQTLSQIQGENNQVLIVASTYQRADEGLYQELTESGCIIWKRYFPDIEEIYALADCFIFPAQENGCLSLPLSVLEAMACNLPVISTRFGALPTMFQGDKGLWFVEKEEDFLPLLERIRGGGMEVNTREKVLPYSWENTVRELEQIYNRVIQT